MSARRARKRDEGDEAPRRMAPRWPPSRRRRRPHRFTALGPARSAERSAPDRWLADPERLRASLQALQAQNATLRQLVAIHDRLGGLVLQGADVAAITSLLSELVGRPGPAAGRAAGAGGDLGSCGSRSRQPAGWSPSEAYVNRILRTLADDRRPLRVPPLVAFGVDVGCVVTPIVVGDAILGYLVDARRRLRRRGRPGVRAS